MSMNYETAFYEGYIVMWMLQASGWWRELVRWMWPWGGRRTSLEQSDSDDDSNCEHIEMYYLYSIWIVIQVIYVFFGYLVVNTSFIGTHSLCRSRHGLGIVSPKNVI